MKRKLFLLLVLLFVNKFSYANCLEDVSKFAIQICGEISNTGKRELTDVNGRLNAEVSGIVRRVVGGGSATVNARRLIDVYEGVLREDLAIEKFDNRSCRVQMVAVAREEACKTPLQYRACRHPDFGQAGWQKSEVISQSSGWRGGGSNPQNWCNELLNGYVSSRSLGSNYESEVLSSSQESKKDWKGHVSYNYHCSIKIHSVPFYNQRTDPRCGVIGR